MPLSTNQVKPLGSTLLLTCQVTVPDSGEDQVDYNLRWTALTDGVLRNINSGTGRFVLLSVFCSHVVNIARRWVLHSAN